MRKIHMLFAVLTCVALLLAGPPLLVFLRSANPPEYYSHIPLIPLISAYLIYGRRKILFQPATTLRPLGGLLMVAGVGTYLAGRTTVFSLEGQAMTAVLGALFFWWGSYHLIYQQAGGKRSVFPLAFLLCAVPLPIHVIEKIVGLLVSGSSQMTRILFTGLCVPFVQHNTIFYLPGFNIEIAKECSGIRSSIALFITAVLAGYIFLDKLWKLVLLALAVIPVTVLKNGIRIVTLYLLSYFIDIRIIEGGFLHKSGGFIFFGLGLFILGLIIWALRE